LAYFRDVPAEQRLRLNFLKASGLIPFLLFFCTSCQMLPPLPAANFKEPGWIVREGQAVWKLPHGKSEIAGEVLVATKNGDSRAFVQFSKSPFPLVVAQIANNRWEIEFPPQHRRYAGSGEPPNRLIWLRIPQVLAGKPPPKNWSWGQTESNWHLENDKTKESVEGFFTQ
jgi:hypothetical protein